MFNDFIYVFIKVGCGFRFSLRKKSKSSTYNPGIFLYAYVIGFFMKCGT